MLFREAILSLLGMGPGSSMEDKYCQACRDLGDDDCENCSKQIEVIDV